MRTIVLSLVAGLVVLIAGAGAPPGVTHSVEPAGEIEIIAGGGFGNGGPATNAAVNAVDVAYGPGGELYIADTSACQIRTVTAGVISAVAGTGTCAYSGDGGPAASAELATPGSLATAPDGSIYVGTNDCRIRRVSSGGTIDTIAGTGACALTSADSLGGATATPIQRPTDLFVASDGTIFIAENNRRILRLESGVLTAVAGTGLSSSVSSPDGSVAVNARITVHGLALDSAGDVIFSERSGGCRIRKVSNGLLSTVAGAPPPSPSPCTHTGDGGSPTSATLNMPGSLVLLPDASLLIQEADGCAVRRISGGVIDTYLTGACGQLAASADGARLALAPGCIVNEFTGGVISHIAGTGDCHWGGDGGPATNATFDRIVSLEIAPTDDIFVIENDCRLRVVSQGIVNLLYNACGSGNMYSVEVLPNGEILVGGSVVERLENGTLTHVAGVDDCASDPSAAIGGPAATMPICGGVTDMHYDEPTGDLYVVDSYCILRKINAQGTVEKVAGTATGAPPSGCQFGTDGMATETAIGDVSAVTTDAAGNVLIAIPCSVRMIDATGMLHTISGRDAYDLAARCDMTPNPPSGVPSSEYIGGHPHIAPDGTVFLGSARYEDGYLTEFGFGSAFDSTGALIGVVPGETVAANDKIGRMTLGADGDGDGIPDTIDDCPSVSNSNQANSVDWDWIANAGTPFRDYSNPTHDLAGDACDPDDDNDGLSDSDETSGPPCASASLVTNHLAADTDGDRVIDGAECSLGSDPASAASKPPFLIQPDADADGAPDALEAPGCDTVPDCDGDRLRDGVEFRGYGASTTAADTDGDGCSDLHEAANVNFDRTVSASDLGVIAASFGQQNANRDIDKNGVIGAADLGLAAMAFGSCPST